MSTTVIQDTQEGPKQSQQSQPVYVPTGTGRSYKSPIDQVTILVTGEQTGGAYFMAEVVIAPGGGNPPHIHHREEETFYLQQGSLTIQVGGKTVVASAGDFVRLPRGVVHSFQNTGNVETKVLLMCSPAGLEKFFEEGFYPAADWQDAMPPMNDAFMARLLTAAAKCDLEFLPPASGSVLR